MYEIEIPAPDTANRFEAGHRLRVDISSSDFPRFDVNSNTGVPEAVSRRKVVATNRSIWTRTAPRRCCVTQRAGLTGRGARRRHRMMSPARPAQPEQVLVASRW
ncbi:hypothetical protein GCM10017744_017700 [Streptomyces antimycoticus]